MTGGPIVLDASMALAWALDESLVPVATRALAEVTHRGAAVPVLWRYEVANGLLMAERRGRIGRDVRADALAALADLPIEIDSESAYCAWRDTLALADTHRLTVHDAAYLDLALRRDVPLASLDKALCRAAEAAGVALL